ncbi:MAG: DUF2911 domain-containing protein [Flavobacteriaceae bacterium]|nr:DUF2911 domain-containing protein [Flavobacteriaceae bacterium]
MKKRNIKLIITISFILFINSTINAQNFPNLDQSPHDIVYYRTNKISPPTIKVLYGRPKKNGRELFGELVPYHKIWGVGANEATEIKFYTDVIFGGQKVSAGTYVLYAIPDQKEWTLILNSNLDVWGTKEYESKYDVARVKVKVSRAEPIEAFSIGFKDKKKYIRMTLAWGTTRVSVPIKA